MRSRISIRGCVRPSVRRSVGPSVLPSVTQPCKSVVFDQNYYQYQRERILRRVSGLVLHLCGEPFVSTRYIVRCQRLSSRTALRPLPIYPAPSHRTKSHSPKAQPICPSRRGGFAKFSFLFIMEYHFSPFPRKWLPPRPSWSRMMNLSHISGEYYIRFFVSAGSSASQARPCVRRTRANVEAKWREVQSRPALPNQRIQLTPNLNGF